VEWRSVFYFVRIFDNAMTVEYSTGAEITVTMGIGSAQTAAINLGGFCRWVRMTADGIDVGQNYRMYAGLNNVTFYPVCVNATPQMSATNALFIIFEIGYAQWIQIWAAGVQTAVRTINVRGYSL